MLTCSQCGAKNPEYINRHTGQHWCKSCFDKKNSCVKCGLVQLGGINVGKDYYCLDCYLKEGWNIKRRRPKTEKDKRILKDLAEPIWEK